MIGYFGKIPSHGDFVSRGLPPALVEAWDAWLQQCIHESQRQLGDQWLTHYLTSPAWRFAISPGILGPEGLGGVMMPSVDRVGRYFPLMIGATGAPPLLDWFQKQTAWYGEIEELARASLEPKFRLEQLFSIPEPVLNSRATMMFAVPGIGLRLPFDTEMVERVAGLALQWHSLWWIEELPNVEPWLLVCEKMPRAHGFRVMLDKGSLAPR